MNENKDQAKSIKLEKLFSHLFWFDNLADTDFFTQLVTFLQKEILDRDYDSEKNINFINIKKIAKDIENFFAEKNDTLLNQTYFEKFKEELNVENTRNMMVDEYIKHIKSVFLQAKSIADKGENDFNNFKKELNAKSKRTKIEDIEMELSNTKNRNYDNNNQN